MPDTFKLPWMLGAVVPLVCSDFAFVSELVAFAFRKSTRANQVLWPAARRVPGFSAVIRTLNDLAKPTAGLRNVNPVGIDR
jgi:hypothetical protein